MKNYIRLLFVSMALFGLTNCDKKNSDPAVSYRWENGVCLNNSNQVVASTLCTSAVNSDYYLGTNGQCISRVTGQLAAYQLCQNNNGVVNGFIMYNGSCINNSTGTAVPLSYCQGGGVGGQCIGVYYVNQFTPVNCGQQNGWVNGQQVYNCSGYQLYNSQGQIVTCP